MYAWLGDVYMDITFNYYPNAKTKAVTLSYDDGMVQDRKMIKILNEHKMKCTFHLNSGRIGTDGRFVTADEIKRLYAGHEVSLHTRTHPSVEYIPQENLVYEVMDDRQSLEKMSGRIVNGLSYPNGSFSKDVADTLRKLGVVYARTTLGTGEFSLPEDFLLWHPTIHHLRGLKPYKYGMKPDHDIMLKYARSFVQYSEGPKNMPILYIWGHSYEFDEIEDAWDALENFCDYICEIKNIWFATNIEVYNYVTALKSLKFSADCSMVYNPSAFSVWIGANDKPVEIKGGEFKKL